MSANTAELTLIIQAKNLAETELAKVRTSLSKMVVTAKVVAEDMITAFKGVGRRIGRQLGNIATDLLTGGDLTNNFIFLGAAMAGAAVEGLTAHLVPEIMARIAASSFFAPIIATFGAAGVTAGTVFDAAVAIGIAALPFVLLAAAVAALVYLITNPEARQKAREVAIMIQERITQFLFVELPRALFDIGKKALGFLGDAFRAGFAAVEKQVRIWVGNIEDIILAIPRAVGKAIDAFGKLIAATPEVGGHGYQYGQKPPGHAEGGWVGLHGPEVIRVGERGPEYVTANHRLNGKSQAEGVTIVGVSESQITDMIERRLLFRLQRAAPTVLRT